MKRIRSNGLARELLRQPKRRTADIAGTAETPTRWQIYESTDKNLEGRSFDRKVTDRQASIAPLACSDYRSGFAGCWRRRLVEPAGEPAAARRSQLPAGGN